MNSAYLFLPMIILLNIFFFFSTTSWLLKLFCICNGLLMTYILGLLLVKKTEDAPQEPVSLPPVSDPAPAAGPQLLKSGSFAFRLAENGDARLVHYSGCASRVEVPKAVQGHPVTVIAETAFQGFRRITEVILPEGITTIEQLAFSGCKNLLSLQLPESIASIAEHAFSNCPCLTLLLPAGTTAGYALDYARRRHIHYVVLKPEPEQPQEPFLTQTVVFGRHLYRGYGEDSSVFFVDPSRGIRKMLVDYQGSIQNFPGIIEEAFWTRLVSPSAIEPVIRFRTSFSQREDKWIMLWQIQPDGMYWADEDGFGMENDPEVTLYTYVDQNGDFTGPFRIYEVGSHRYGPA